jgi:probable selenium-dependent hydroxylase accessory protein YqeC
VFRLERFLAVTGLAKGQLITPDAVGRLLGHEEGGLQGVPRGAKVEAFLNKLDLMDDPGRIDEVAKAVAVSAGDRISRVVAGTVRGGVSATTYTVSRVRE